MEQNKEIAASFVVRAYNSAATIERTLRSALSQEFSGAYEIVVIDDGSTDNTVDIVRQFKDERIKLVLQENKGIVEAANIGFREARGDIVMFLDADDEALPQALFHATHALSDPSAQFAYSDYFEEYKGERKLVHAADPFKAPAGAMCWRRDSVLAESGFEPGTIFPEYQLLLKTWGRWQITSVAEPIFIYHRTDSSITGDRTLVQRSIKNLREQFPERSAEIALIRSYEPLAL